METQTRKTRKSSLHKMQLTAVVEGLQHFAVNALVGLPIRMRYEYIDITTRGFSPTEGATRYCHQVWVNGLSSIPHLHKTVAIIISQNPTSKQESCHFHTKSRETEEII